MDEDRLIRSLALVAASFQAGSPVEALSIAGGYLAWVDGAEAATQAIPSLEDAEQGGPIDPIEVERLREKTQESRARRKAEKEARKLEGIV